MSDAKLSASEAAASQWLLDRGYSGITDAERTCLLDPLAAADALGMLGHWIARCGLPEHLAAPLAARVRERAISHLDACSSMDSLRDVQKEWIGHRDIEVGVDTTDSVRKFLAEYIALDEFGC